MNKRSKPIAWHEECLRNWGNSIDRDEAELERLQDRIKRHRSEHSFYAEQIAAAKSKGKTSFDADQFMKRKGKA